MGDFPAGSTREVGQLAEQEVRAALSERGLSFVAANVHAAGGEIDLIARGDDGDPLFVFIEVRARTRADLGRPTETVGSSKQRHLIRAATSWLIKEELWERVAVRFDVVGVNLGTVDTPDNSRNDPDPRVPGNQEKTPTLDWIEGAFEAGG